MLLLRGCEVDLDRREVRRGDGTETLSEMEAGLLRYLAERPHRPVTRDELLVDVWGFPEPVVTRAVDNTLMRLRGRVERDPKRPDHLLTVRGVGVCFVPLPATPAPRPRGRLFGRARELRAIAEALDRSPLVTLHGPGGVGKTRLAQEWTSRGGGRLVPLGEMRTRAGALRRISDFLGVGLPTADPDAISTRLGRALARHGELLILDEVELLLPDLAADVARWLDQGGGLQLLVTSRRTLRIRGEAVVPVGPLDPAAALELLADRSPVPLGAGGEGLCERLDRLPLAIELVAPRLATVPPGEAWLDLGDPGGPDLPDRQRTLDAVLERSWRPLSDAARRGLATLAAAPGAWSLADARSLLEDGAVLDELTSAALLYRDGDGYRMLETTRRFVARRGLGRGRLLAWLADRCEEDRAALADDPSALHRLAARLPAAEAALEDPDSPDALRALLALGPVLLTRGPLDARIVDALARHREGAAGARASVLRGALLQLLGRLAEAADAFEEAEGVGGSVAAEARARRGFLAAARGDPARGMTLARRAVQEARALGDDAVEALALLRTGALLHQLGRPVEARRALRSALRIHQRRGDRAEEARALGNVALFDIELGRHDAARPALSRALEHARRTGSRLAELQLTINLGGLAHLSGRLAEARERLDRARALAEEAGDVVSEALARWGLGALALEGGDRDAARRELGRAAAAFAGSGSPFEALTLGWVALQEAADGDPEEAAALLDRARRIAPSAGPTLDALAAFGASDEELAAHEPAAASSSAVRQALRVVRAISPRSAR